MKATPTKTEAAQPAKKTAPFFNKGAEQGFFKPAAPGIQTKLTVGEPDDVYEKEADQTADKVIQRLSAGAPSSAPGKEKIDRKPIFESEGEAQEGVQRKSSGTGTPEASPAVESGLRTSKGSGSAMPEGTKNQMESSFGADFSGVKIHTDSNAHKMNKDLQAQAFTHGKDIYFDSGKYNPASSGGQHLLAHELTHVVQQTGKGSSKKSVQRKASTAAGASGRAAVSAAASAAGSQEQAGRQELVREKEPTADEVKRKAVSGSNGAPPGDGAPPEDGVQRKISTTGLSIQRDGDPAPAGGGSDPQAAPAPSDADKLKSIAPAPEGFIRGDNDSNFQLVVTGFALKDYDNVQSANPPGEVKKPKPGTRNTKQDSVWKTAVKDNVKKDVAAQAKSNDEEKIYMLTLTGGSKEKGETQVIGNLETLSKATTVPFWDKDGKPTIHQIEHIIDWQILGNDADTYNNNNNLILLDKETNRAQGEQVKTDIRDRVQKVMDYYKEKGIVSPIATGSYDGVQANFTIFFKDFTRKHVDTKSIIQKKDLEQQTADSVFSIKTIRVGDVKIPEGSCVIRTAVKGEGYIVPYKHKHDNIEIVGDAKTSTMTSITQTKIVAPSPGIEGGSEKLELTFVKEDKLGKDYYRLTQRGYATVLKESLKLVGLSPIEFNDEVEVSPLTGVTAEGKVKSDISLLKDADIRFGLEGGEFSVSATIESDVLKGKLPSPLDIDYSDLTISVGTKDPLTVGGEIGFSIKKLGKGNLRGLAGTKGFGVGGKFLFDNAQSFKKAEIGFSYSREYGKGEGKWEGNGELAFEKDVIPGVKKGDIKIGYKDSVLSGAGSFELTIPKMDKVDVTAQFDANGNFSITGKTGLKNVPGIKSSDISVTVTKDDSGYSLAMTGTAVPNLPNVPGLGASLTVSYNKGVFLLEGTGTYKEGKLDGSITVGVTNAVVDENGVPSKDATDDSFKIYGNGSITLTLLEGVTATLHAALDAKGEVFIWGEIDINKKPFDPVDIDKQIFKIDTSIPLAGIPFVNVNLQLGTGLRFYFHWDPLTIELKATLKKTNIKDMGDAGGDLTAKLHSNAKAGIELSVRAGVGVTVTVVTVSVNVTGSVALEINAELGAEAAATWDLKKGLQLESADAYLKAVPSVIFKITGDVRAVLDLLITTSEIYKKVLGSAQKQIDLNDYAFGVKVPLKIDDNGKIAGIDFDKVTLTPTFDEKAGADMSDRVMNGDDKAQKEQKEKEAKDKIRQMVKEKLAAKKAEGNANLNEYATQLKEEVLKSTSPDLTGFVDQVIQEELKTLDAGAVPAAAPAPPPDPNAGDPVQTKKVEGLIQRTPAKVDKKAPLYALLDVMTAMEEDALPTYAAGATPQLAKLRKEVDALPDKDIPAWQQKGTASLEVLNEIIKMSEFIPASTKGGGPLDAEIKVFRDTIPQALNALATDQEAAMVLAMKKARDNYLNKATASFLDDFQKIRDGVPKSSAGIDKNNPFVDGFAADGRIVWPSLSAELSELDFDLDSLQSQLKSQDAKVAESKGDPDKRMKYLMEWGDYLVKVMKRAQALGMVYNAFAVGSFIFSKIVEDYAQEASDIGYLSDLKELVIRKVLDGCKGWGAPDDGLLSQANGRLNWLIDWATKRNIRLEEVRARVKLFADFMSLMVGLGVADFVAGMEILKGTSFAMKAFRFTLTSLAFTESATFTKGVLTGDWPTAEEFSKQALMDMATMGLLKGTQALVGKMYGGVAKIPTGVAIGSTFATLWLWSTAIQLYNSKDELDLSMVAGTAGKAAIKTVFDLAMLGFATKGLKTPELGKDAIRNADVALGEPVRVEWNRIAGEVKKTAGELKDWHAEKARGNAKGSGLIDNLLGKYNQLHEMIPRMKEAGLMTETESATIRDNIAREMKMGRNLRDMIRLGIEPTGEGEYTYSGSKENLDYFLSRLKSDGMLSSYSGRKNGVYTMHTSDGEIQFMYPKGGKSPVIDIDLPSEEVKDAAPDAPPETVKGALAALKAGPSVDPKITIAEIKQRDAGEMVYWLARKDVGQMMSIADNPFNKDFIDAMTADPKLRGSVIVQSAAVIDIWYRSKFEKVSSGKSRTENFIAFIKTISAFNHGLEVSSLSEAGKIIDQYLNTAKGTILKPGAQDPPDTISAPGSSGSKAPFQGPGDWLARNGFQTGTFVQADFPGKTWVVQMENGAITKAWKFSNWGYPPDSTVDCRPALQQLQGFVTEAGKTTVHDQVLGIKMKAPVEKLAFLEGIAADDPGLVAAKQMIAQARGYMSGKPIKTTPLLGGGIIEDLQLHSLSGITPAELALVERVSPAAYEQLLDYATTNSNIFSIKGKIAEELILVGSEMPRIQQQIAARAQTLGIPASDVRFVKDVRGKTVDKNGKEGSGELTDGAFVAPRNGKLLFLGAFESKSKSNLSELAHRDDDGSEFLGQLGWDFERMRNMVVIVEGREYSPSQILVSRRATLWFGFRPRDTNLSARGLAHIRTGFPNFELIRGEIRDTVLNELAARIRAQAVARHTP